jgi:hypothetical protein
MEALTHHFFVWRGKFFESELAPRRRNLTKNGVASLLVVGGKLFHPRNN